MGVTHISSASCVPLTPGFRLVRSRSPPLWQLIALVRFGPSRPSAAGQKRSPLKALVIRGVRAENVDFGAVGAPLAPPPRICPAPKRGGCGADEVFARSNGRS